MHAGGRVCVHACMCTSLCGSVVVWVCGCVVVWVCGCVGVWVCGCMNMQEVIISGAPGGHI